MRHRVALLIASAAMTASSVFGGACSSSTADDLAPGLDAGPGSDSTVTADGNPGATDSSLQGQDSGTSDTFAPPVDSGPGASDAPFAFDGPLANCSALKGTCDIVSQNCGPNMECIGATDTDGGNTTVCSPSQPSEHLPAGHSCCPSSTNPCLPGLECIGSACSTDAAAPQTGQCTPHCCIGPDGGGDDTPCGTDPQGVAGHCDLTIVDNGDNPLYAVCTYAQNCEPFQVEPCPSGSACEIEDPSGTATCTQIFTGTDAGAFAVGASCTFANQCEDGTMCIMTGGSDAGTCLQLCYANLQGDPPPFDAGAKSGQIGFGGCPGNQNCGSAPGLFPDWLGLCQ